MIGERARDLEKRPMSRRAHRFPDPSAHLATARQGTIRPA